MHVLGYRDSSSCCDSPEVGLLAGEHGEKLACCSDEVWVSRQSCKNGFQLLQNVTAIRLIALLAACVRQPLQERGLRIAKECRINSC